MRVSRFLTLANGMQVDIGRMTVTFDGSDISTTPINLENHLSFSGDVAADVGDTMMGGLIVPLETWTHRIPGLLDLRFAEPSYDRTLSDGTKYFYLYGHEMNNVLASKQAGTFEMWKASDSIHTRANLGSTDLELPKYVAYHVGAGNITGQSIGIGLYDESWMSEEAFKDAVEIDYSGDVIKLTYKMVKVREGSVVANPQFEQTDVSVLNVEEQQEKMEVNPVDKSYEYRRRAMKMKYGV